MESGSIRHTAAYPKYTNLASRLRSYDDWPKAMKQKPDQLADAGFFYTKTSDRVACFSCGGVLRDWEDDDDPWEQHGLHFESCKYLQLIKGYGYHGDAILNLTKARAEKKRMRTFDSASSSSSSLSSFSSPAVDLKMYCADWNEKISELRKCKICYDNEYNSVFIPCGHVIACVKCAAILIECPVCRSPFKNVMKVYFS